MQLTTILNNILHAPAEILTADTYVKGCIGQCMVHAV